MSVSVGTAFDKITGTSTDITYLSVPTWGPYPDSNLFSLFPSVYAARLYAASLSTLDLASSGQVAFSLNDSQRLTLSQSSNDTRFQATSSNNIVITNSNTSAIVRLDSNAVISLTAQSNILLSTSNTLSAVINSNLAINVNNSNSTIAADSTGVGSWLNSTSVRVGLNDSSAYTQGTSSNSVVFGAAQVAVTNAGSNAYATFDNTQSKIYNAALVSAEVTGATFKLTQSDKSAVTDADLVIADAAKEITQVAGGSSNAWAKFNSNGAITTFSSNSISENTSNFSLGVLSQALFSHGNSNAFVKITDSNLQLSALSNTFLGSNTKITVTQFALSNAASNASVTLTDATLSLYAQSNLTARGDIDVLAVAGTASNSWQKLSSSGAFSGFSSNSLTFTTSNLTGQASNVTFSTNSNATLTLSTFSSNATVFGKTDALVVATSTSNGYLRVNTDGSLLYGATSNIVTLPSSNAFFSQWTSNTAVYSTQRTELSVFNSNAWIRLDKDTGLTMSASNAITLGSSNINIGGSNVYLASQNSNAAISLASDGTATFKAATNSTFKIGPSNILQIDSGGITVNGDIDISGSLNSINISQVELSILDKKILLSDSPGAPVNDGFTTNHESGVAIIGADSGKGWSATDKRAQKSLYWMYGDSNSAQASLGVGNVGTANYDKESYWEMQGGSFRLSVVQDASGQTKKSYGFRINNSAELELFKIDVSGGSNYSYKRVAKFGVSRA